MVSISRAWRAGASAALLLAACGPPSAVKTGAAPAAAVPVLPPRPLAQVFVLEAAGGSPDDTVVAVPAGERRVIVLRRSGPDYGLFATLVLPAVPGAAAGAVTNVRLAPAPGLYSLQVDLPANLSDSATITFSYGAHFVAPAGARARYGSNLAFEKELAIGRLGADSQVVFLPTTRPGSDMLRAPLAGPGRYLVAAPR